MLCCERMANRYDNSIITGNEFSKGHNHSILEHQEDLNVELRYLYHHQFKPRSFIIQRAVDHRVPRSRILHLRWNQVVHLTAQSPLTADLSKLYIHVICIALSDGCTMPEAFSSQTIRHVACA